MAMDHVEASFESKARGPLLAAGAAVGFAAVVWLLSHRKASSSHPVAESILDLCDAAAAKMDEILKSELGVANS